MKSKMEYCVVSGDSVKQVYFLQRMWAEAREGERSVYVLLVGSGALKSETGFKHICCSRSQRGRRERIIKFDGEKGDEYCRKEATSHRTV